MITAAVERKHINSPPLCGAVYSHPDGKLGNHLMMITPISASAYAFLVPRNKLARLHGVGSRRILPSKTPPKEKKIEMYL